MYKYDPNFLKRFSNYNPFEHCCGAMNKYLDPETNDNCELLSYEPDTRSYYFTLHEDGKISFVILSLLYCPWCGTKLPEDLGEKMEEILEKEYGITEKDCNAQGWDDEKDLPKEFQTDEWWKKRGL